MGANTWWKLTGNFQFPGSCYGMAADFGGQITGCSVRGEGLRNILVTTYTASVTKFPPYLENACLI